MSRSFSPRSNVRSRGSAVVEPQWMDSHECSLTPRPGARQCFVRKVVYHRCWSDSLGHITSSVVALDKHSSRIMRPEWHPSVPDVRDEEGNITCLREDGNHAAARPLQGFVCQPLWRRRLSRCVAAWNHSGRSGIDRAVPEVEVGRYRENGIGNSRIPSNAGITRDMWSAVDVPKATEVPVVARLLPPSRIGNHMAVLPYEGLHDLEDPLVTDCPLDEVAPIEHLVAKRLGFLGRISPLVWRDFLEDPFDVSTERGEFFSAEHLVEKHISVSLEALHRSGNRIGTQSQISGRTSEHSPILPSTDLGQQSLVTDQRQLENWCRSREVSEGRSTPRVHRLCSRVR